MKTPQEINAALNKPFARQEEEQANEFNEHHEEMLKEIDKANETIAAAIRELKETKCTHLD